MMIPFNCRQPQVPKLRLLLSVCACTDPHVSPTKILSLIFHQLFSPTASPAFRKEPAEQTPPSNHRHHGSLLVVSQHVCVRWPGARSGVPCPVPSCCCRCRLAGEGSGSHLGGLWRSRTVMAVKVCVFYYCRTYYKAVRVGGGGEWRTCAMRDEACVDEKE